MLYDNFNLLDQINSAINTKWYRKGVQPGELPMAARVKDDHTGLIDKKKFTDAKNGELIERLEEKIASLENRYDQMLFFINFLVDNFPSLVLNITQTNQATNVLFSDTAEKDKTTGHWTDSKSASVKKEPHPTRREKDVLDLLEKGFCAKEIASILYISETTVITHKKNLKEKFNAKNTAELIAKAGSAFK